MAHNIGAIATCVSCAFWNRGFMSADGKAQGQCRNKAPHISFVKGAAEPIRTIWPLVLFSDWCGQHSVVTEVEEADGTV